MNLVLEIVASKKSLKLTLQQVIQRLKEEEDSSSVTKLAAYLSLGASIHQICKSPRYIVHTYLNNLNTKMVDP